MKTHQHPHPPGAPPSAAPAEDDGRDALALSSAENADLCAGCVKCCTYLSIQIDTPRAAWEYDQWIWALHHQGIQLYLERPEAWFLLVEARCRQLQGDGRCAIHGRHPVLCREYDPRSCERRYPLSDVRAWFHDAAELERWLERERPSHFRALMRYRNDTAPGPPVADARRDRAAAATLIPLAALATAGSGAGRNAPALAAPRRAGARRNVR